MTEFDVFRDWSLFLDRDGVINHRRIDTYLASWENFEFIPKSDQAIVELSKIFKHLFIVTNQQGVAKGITTYFELDHLHYRLRKHIDSMGGHIDRIYFCPEHQIYAPPCRKPNPGMALQAAEEFPEVNLHKSIMVGDFYTDILMGQQVGMKTIFIENENSIWQSGTSAPDHTFASLWHFFEAIGQIQMP